MTLLGLCLMAVGFVMTVSEPLKDWKVLWGSSLFIVGILCVVLTIL